MKQNAVKMTARRGFRREKIRKALLKAEIAMGAKASRAICLGKLTLVGLSLLCMVVRGLVEDVSMGYYLTL